MSVWLTIPSARPPEEAEKCVKLWRERGYKIALCVDSGDDAKAKDALGDLIIGVPHGGYRGYAVSVNALIALILQNEPQAEWFIAAGDDTEPDPNHSAEEIARQCVEHFAELHIGRKDAGASNDATFGVMQPTGDRWGTKDRAYIDHVCGSAWIGREFARRMYQGKGPLWPGYQHMFVDQELQEVAIQYGVLWQRRDLIHKHNHWGRGPAENPNALQNRDIAIPEHLKKWNTAAHWNESKKLFETRKAAGFPGSEPL